MTRSSARIRVIGGSGLYHMAEMTTTDVVSITTPFDEPSAAIL
jgi:purine nucleoside phosphorylase